MTSHKLFDTLAKRYCDTLAEEINREVQKIRNMKPLTKKETLAAKKSRAIKDLTLGIDSLTHFLKTEFMNTQKELEQFKHGVSPTQKSHHGFRESGNRKIYK